MRELDPTRAHANLYANTYTNEQNQQFKLAFDSITEGFRLQQIAGITPDSQEVQDLVRQHYEFCLQFWKPTRAAYKALAQSYLFPTEYRDSYESIQSGLAKYHHDAMVIWADRNLE
jgi:hypothetical protein